ncbi:MAG: hypothetical protein O2904_00375 [bacterium]|nr:hypothetical protein [bacterium]
MINARTSVRRHVAPDEPRCLVKPEGEKQREATELALLFNVLRQVACGEVVQTPEELCKGDTRLARMLIQGLMEFPRYVHSQPDGELIRGSVGSDSVQVNETYFKPSNPDDFINRPIHELKTHIANRVWSV